MPLQYQQVELYYCNETPPFAFTYKSCMYGSSIAD